MERALCLFQYTTSRAMQMKSPDIFSWIHSKGLHLFGLCFFVYYAGTETAELIIVPSFLWTSDKNKLLEPPE